MSDSSIDNSKSATYEQMSKENYNFQKIVVAVGVALFFIKFAAWYLTDSVAILTDAIESIVNVVGGFIGLFSLYISTLPPDRNHPYGHGKIEFLSAGVEGTMITVAGIIIIYQAISNLLNPTTIGKLDFGIILIAITAVVNFSVGHLAIKKGELNNSLALIASGKHLKSDTISTVGVIIGLILIMATGLEWIDGVVALIFGFIIIFTGVKIIRRATAGVMDESDEELLSQIVDALNSSRHENWIDIYNLRLVKYGNIYHIDCNMTVPVFMMVSEAQKEVLDVKELIREKFYHNVDFNVQIKACTPEFCVLCSIKDCSNRKHEFEDSVHWTVKNIAGNAHHPVYIDESSENP